MPNDQIQLLQFLICKEFREIGPDNFSASTVKSNIYIPKFPQQLNQFHAVTCWRKDGRFHKEVIEYETDYGLNVKSPHMDIEPAKGSVLFRWHAHQFPNSLEIDRPTILKIRVVLDWKTCFESYIMIEQGMSDKTED